MSAADDAARPVLQRCCELILEQPSPADLMDTVNAIREWLIAEFGEARASRALIDCLLVSLLLREVELTDFGSGEFGVWSLGGASGWTRATDDAPVSQ